MCRCEWADDGGGVFYSLDDAKGFPYSEFDLPHFDWRELGAHNQ